MVEHAIPPGRRAVTVESYLPGRMTIRVGPGAPVWLVVTETWNPGWVAHADGQTLDVLVANHAVMAVLVGSTTETRLTVAFQPQEVIRGFWLGGIGWIAALVLFVLPRRRRPGAAAELEAGLDPDDVVVPRGLRRLILWVDMLRSAVVRLRNRESADEEPDEEPDEGSDEDLEDEEEARREPERGF
jgi:hypothetical protein